MTLGDRPRSDRVDYVRADLVVPSVREIAEAFAAISLSPVDEWRAAKAVHALLLSRIEGDNEAVRQAPPAGVTDEMVDAAAWIVARDVGYPHRVDVPRGEWSAITSQTREMLTAALAVSGGEST